MPAWFDIMNFERLANPQFDDEQGMMASVKAVDALIQAEVSRVSPPR